MPVSNIKYKIAALPNLAAHLLHFLISPTFNSMCQKINLYIWHVLKDDMLGKCMVITS